MTCHLDGAVCGVAYRIGRLPDPWRLPPWSAAQSDGTFGNRWDDPDSIVRVCYASSQRRGTFVEVLSRFRPDPRLLDDAPTDAVLDALAELTGGGTPSPAPGVLDVRTWAAGRALGSAEVPGLFADIGTVSSLAELSRDLAHLLISLRLREFDAALIRSSDRSLTQQIARHVLSCTADAGDGRRKYDGIKYMSRLGDNVFNWAIFEPFVLTAASSRPLDPSDDDLLTVASDFGLTLV